MNVANRLTLARLFLIPGFLLALLWYEPEKDFLRFFALGLFVIAVVTDAVDGYLARTTGQRTRLGMILDPLADKLLLVTAFFALAMLSNLPASLRLPRWAPFIILARDLMIVVGALSVYRRVGRTEFPPSFLGKLTTACQMATILAMLSQTPGSDFIWKGTLVVTVISTVDYLRRGNAWFQHASPARPIKPSLSSSLKIPQG